MTRNPKKSTDLSETPDNKPEAEKAAVPAPEAAGADKEKKAEDVKVDTAPLQETGKTEGKLETPKTVSSGAKPIETRASSFEGMKPAFAAVGTEKTAEKTSAEKSTTATSSAKPVSAKPAKTGGGGVFLMMLGVLVLVVVLGAVAFFVVHQPTTAQFKQHIARQDAELSAMREQLTATTLRLDSAEKALQNLNEQEKNTQEVLAGLAQSLPVSPVGDTAGSAELRKTVQAMANRVAGLEKDVGTLSNALTVMKNAGAEAPALDLSVLNMLEKRQEELSRVVTSLRETVNEMEKAQSVSQSLTQNIVLFGQRLDEVQKAVADMKANATASSALLLAVVQLRSAVERGDAFESELKAVQGMAPASMNVEALVSPFVGYAAKGVPTEEALLTAFPQIAPRVLLAALEPEDSPLLAGTLERLSSLVSVRRVDAGAEGDSTQAVMARAEAKIEARDIAGAIVELSALKGAPAMVMQPWLADATARLAARNVMSALSAEAIAYSTK